MLGTAAIQAQGAAFELNDDGRDLLANAGQVYDNDMRDRSMITDEKVQAYVKKVAQRLLSHSNSLVEGVQLDITIVDSPNPEIYSYVDGHLIVSSGLVFGLDNEAQLAGLLAPQIAHISEGYYLALYQQIKTKERQKRRAAFAGAIFGTLLDAAVDYTAATQRIEITDEIRSGDLTYKDVQKRMLTISTAQGTYHSIKDIIANMPAQDAQGRAIDPRLQFEPVADAQGMIICATAGYDAQACADGWGNIHHINQTLVKREAQMYGQFAEQLRAQRSFMRQNMLRMRQQLGDSGLVQTPSHIKASRVRFAASLVNLKEVRAVSGGSVEKGKELYMQFFQGIILPKARVALDKERYDEANRHFQNLYDRGVRTAQISYGLAKSKLGDFAFGASPAELKAAEKAYREAARLDPAFAEPYRGLAELYSDTDDYEEAIKAWHQYLKRSPKAKDRKKIERKIRILQRKAQR